MNVMEAISRKVAHIRKGRTFTTGRFKDMGARSAVDKALSRLVSDKKIKRLRRGVFVRPLVNRYVGEVTPDISSIVEAIARERGEKIQLHGARTAQMFGLTTQVPVDHVYYTSGSSRKVKLGKLTVRFIHSSDSKKFVLNGTRVGHALAALRHLGKNEVTTASIQKLRDYLSCEDFALFCSAPKPGWMSKVVRDYCSE